MMWFDPGTSNDWEEISSCHRFSRGGYEPTRVPVTSVREDYPLEVHTAYIYHNSFIILW